MRSTAHQASLPVGPEAGNFGGEGRHPGLETHRACTCFWLIIMKGEAVLLLPHNCCLDWHRLHSCELGCMSSVRDLRAKCGKCTTRPWALWFTTGGPFMLCQKYAQSVRA